MGTMSTARSGRTCRLWSSGSIIPAARIDANFPDGGVAAAKNYCRNPDNDLLGLWCHTMFTFTWEYCDVPLCSGKFSYLDV